MKTITFYVMALLCLVTAKLNAQTFQERAAAIADTIESINRQEKDSLKAEVERVNNLLDNNTITAQEAELKKKQYARVRAGNIERRIAAEEEKLSALVKEKAEGTLDNSKSGDFALKSDGLNKKDSVKFVIHSRTTSQFVIGIGGTRIITNGKVDNENFRARSWFYEWGFAFNTRLLRDNNLLHLKYGLSLNTNILRPENNRIFVINGDKTVLQYNDFNLKKSAFLVSSVVIPVHMEFDITKKQSNADKTYFAVQRGLRIGLGGYAGVNTKAAQIVKYIDKDDNRVRNRTKGDFNINNFTYGLSAYIGHGSVSFYAKYDLQPVFKNNDSDQNNLSLGIRLDLN